jgi:hypothetical protein
VLPEVALGGLMAGVLYSLVALGFVLIFKASGVFNFAQGAMVLFAALSMARLSEWIPGWLGIDNLWLSNGLAFVLSNRLSAPLSATPSRLGIDSDSSSLSSRAACWSYTSSTWRKAAFSMPMSTKAASMPGRTRRTRAL